MSPDAILNQGDAESFPRVSGDEPRIRARERREMEFSPRERG